MCLMIMKDKHTEFEFNDIDKIYSHNPDGLGIMFSKNNTLIQDKILPHNSHEAYEFYLQHAKNKICAIHFRKKTHGDITIENAHPYKVNQSISLMHNGILDNHVHNNSKKSDTLHFIEDFLKPLAILEGYLMSSLFKEYIETKVGENKFIFASSNGDFNIINQNKGFYYKNSWVSNLKFQTN